MNQESMKSERFFAMMNLVADDYIHEAHPQKRTYYRSKQAKAHPLRYGICAAVAVMCTFALLFSSNGYAKSLITSAFQTIEQLIQVRGSYSSYATNVNQTVTSGDLSVTISEVYCDGINLFVSYIVESKKGFASYSENYKNYIQIEYDKLDFIQCGDDVFRLNDFGIAGLEGKYIDEYTFAGLEAYSLEGKPFPEAFDLEISISKFIPEISFPKNPFRKKGIRGRWNFDIPVVVNSADIQTIDVQVENNEHTIDKVIVSPIMVTIYTSYPDIYWGTVNYGVICYTDTGKKLLLGSGIYDATTGISWFPREEIINDLEIFVFDFTTLTKKGLEQISYEELKKHAIVSCTIDL